MTLTATNQSLPFAAGIRSASPVFHTLAITFIAGFAVCMALGQFDLRLINGVSVWDKPAKFFMSLSLHAATLGWGLTLLSREEQQAKGVRWATAIFAAAATAELAWISWKAFQGEASHFNVSDRFHQIMYSLMGIGAVSLTIVTVFLGWRIARRSEGLMAYATGTGFILAGILTTIVAGYMSSQTGHSIGGDPTDASGLPFFHWSMTGGDLRVPHFAALHIAQAMPLIAWVAADRRIVNIALAMSVVIVAALFFQALAGIPFLQV